MCRRVSPRRATRPSDALLCGVSLHSNRFKPRTLDFLDSRKDCDFLGGPQGSQKVPKSSHRRCSSRCSEPCSGTATCVSRVDRVVSHNVSVLGEPNQMKYIQAALHRVFQRGKPSTWSVSGPRPKPFPSHSGPQAIHQPSPSKPPGEPPGPATKWWSSRHFAGKPW